MKTYNPYVAAAQALTCEEARQFYVRTALVHLDLTIEAGRTVYLAGQAAWQWHDKHLVPFTLIAIATLSQWFITRHEQTAPTTIAGLLPPAPSAPPAPLDEHQMMDDEHQVMDDEHQGMDDEHQVMDGEHQVMDGEHQVMDGEQQVMDGEHQVMDDDTAFSMWAIKLLGEAEIRSLARQNHIHGWSTKRTTTLVLELERLLQDKEKEEELPLNFKLHKP